MITRYNNDVSVEKYETTQQFPLLSLTVDYYNSTITLGKDFNYKVFTANSHYQEYGNYIAAALRKFRRELLKRPLQLEESQFNVGTDHGIVSVFDLYSYTCGYVTVQFILYGAVATRSAILKVVVADRTGPSSGSQRLMGLRGSRKMSDQVMISEIYPSIRGVSDDLVYLFAAKSAFTGSLWPYAYKRTWSIIQAV